MSEGPNTLEFELSEVERIIGHFFPEEEKKNLVEALTHRSRKGEGGLVNNRRLALLGDAVLYLITTEMYYDEHPEATVEELHNHRDKRKNNIWLGETELAEDLSKFVIVGKSLKGKKPSLKMKATMIEAIIGAIYLSNKDNAREFVIKLILK